MATITVTTAVDELDGSIFDGDVSLRDALAVAVAGDTINFDPVFFANTDPLTNTTINLALGTINIAQDITINGDVNGDGISDVTIDAGASSNIFTVNTANVDLDIHALTLTNGRATFGGAIEINNSTATLTVSNSNFVGNDATLAGGAIRSIGVATVVNSYFSDNVAALLGGAIRAENDLTVVNSTFAENVASRGGAIAGFTGFSVDLINSTLSGNRAVDSTTLGVGLGGAVDADDLNVSNSIILGNTAGAAGTADDDVRTTGTMVSNGANIFGAGVTGSTTGDQLIGVAGLATVFDSVGPVTLSGTTFDAGQVSRETGVGPVIGIADGGVADNAGDNSDIPSEVDLGFDVDRDGVIEATPLEQDASGFSRIVDGTVDIGAAENYNQTWIVDTTDDVTDGDYTTGNLSFREAVTNAAAGDTIIFDGSVFTADGDERSNTTIALTQGQINIEAFGQITINGDVNGDGIADVTLDGSGNNNQRMLSVDFNSGLYVESLTFANGLATNASGAAIANTGTLSVLNSTFTNNYSGVFAGAIRAYGLGNATIANSTFDGNTADRGGAIRNSGGMDIFNSTFQSNHANTGNAGEGGGAIESSDGSLVLTNTTVTGNTAFQTGGGVNVVGGSLVIQNSIVVGNAQTSGSGPGAAVSDDVSSTVGGSSNGGNVFGTSNVTGAGDVISAAPGDVFEATASLIVGTISVDSGLLGDNGGATDTVLLLQGGAAVDQGVSSDIPTEASLGLDIDGDGTESATAVDVDQRGGVRDAGASVDAGAVELDTNRIVVTTTEDTRDGDLSPDDISWREALDLVAEGGTITFDETVFTVDDNPLSNVEIIVSADGEKGITKGFYLDGDLNDDGIADVTFDGAASSDEWMQTITSVGQITLDGLTFQSFNDTGGSGDSGGVMRSRGDLFVLNSNFVDNQSGNLGGALRIYGGTQVISNSFFDGNFSDRGGAIRLTGSDTTIIGSTFTGNFTTTSSTFADGGAIQLGGGALTLINSTLTGNRSIRDGGAIDVSGGTLSVQNSIIAGNSAALSGDEIEGTFASNGQNILGVGTVGPMAGDLVLASADELSNIFDSTGTVTTGGAPGFLAGLAADNGGTGSTVSLRADATNPALDAADSLALDESALGIDLNFDGDTLDFVAFDGRGFERSVDLPDIGSGTADIGAFEVQTTPTEGADFLTGDDGDNTLSGLGGGDVIVGGLGFDVGEIGASRASSLITPLGSGAFAVAGPDGLDRVEGIEKLVFSDAEVLLDATALEGPLPVTQAMIQSFDPRVHDFGPATVTGTDIEITGNAFKFLEVFADITADTVLSFDLTSSDLGEVAGIGFDNDATLQSSDWAEIFKLGGNQTPPGLADTLLHVGGGVRQLYEIPVGSYFTGFFENLVLVADDDFNGSGSLTFGDLAFFERGALTVDGQATRVTSYAPGQDRGAASVSPDGAAITLEGNAWKSVALPTTITSDTWLSFDLEASDTGEILGIGFDTDTNLSVGQLFQLGGGQTAGIQDFRSYTAGDGTQHYSINVGAFYTGSFEHLFFAGDDDFRGGSIEATFSNIEITQGQPVFAGGELVVPEGGYTGQQAGVVTVSADARDVTISGNGWRLLEVNADIDASTVISVEVASTDTGEFLAIGVDDDTSFSPAQFVKLGGTETPPVGATQSYTGAGAFETVEIDIGTLVAAGQYQYVVLAVDDDANGSGTATFRDLEILQDPFSAVVTSYGTNQDQGTAQEFAAGGTLKLTGNAWKDIAIGATDIDANTVLHFEFRSDAEGEVHAIGFDNNDANAFSDPYYQLFGTDAFGAASQAFNGQYEAGDGFQAYEIAVGEDFTGVVDRLVLIADDDVAQPVSDSYVRDVYLTGVGEADEMIWIL